MLHYAGIQTCHYAHENMKYQNVQCMNLVLILHDCLIKDLRGNQVKEHMVLENQQQLHLQQSNQQQNHCLQVYYDRQEESLCRDISFQTETCPEPEPEGCF